MVLIKYDLYENKCSIIDVKITKTIRGAYAYNSIKRDVVKYIDKNAVNNYISVSVDGVYCMPFTDDFDYDIDLVRETNINRMIEGKKRIMEHLRRLRNQEIMELERKIEYFKSKLNQ